MRIGDIEIQNGLIRDAGYWDGMTVEELDFAAARFRQHRRQLAKQLAQRILAATATVVGALLVIVLAYGLPSWLVMRFMEPGWMREIASNAALGVVTLAAGVWLYRYLQRAKAAQTTDDAGIRELIDAIESDATTIDYIQRRRKNAVPDRVGGGWQPGTTDKYPRATE